MYNHTKKIYNILISLICIFLISACGEKEVASESQDSHGPKWPVLKVAMEVSYPPFEFKDEYGEPMGFDVDIIKAVAERIGYRVELVDTPWTQFLESLNTEACDLWISGISITPERLEKVSFSEPYLDTFNAVFVLDNPENKSIQKFEDLIDKKVSAAIDTVNYYSIRDLKTEAREDDILVTKTYYLAFKALASGQVDATMGNTKVLENYAKYVPEIRFRKFRRDPGVDIHYGIAVKKDNEKLLQELNMGLSLLKQDGGYEKIYRYWFGRGGIH